MGGLLTASKVLSAPHITPEDVPAAPDKAEEAPEILMLGLTEIYVF